jgi:Pyruvate/2-oxoacid:ferredoxin oxidoreductase gamma subunit
VADRLGLASLPAHPLPSKYTHNLATRINCIIAGSAGQRIGTSAGIFCRAAVLSGLWVSQKNDYPVTVRSGYSLSEVILSAEKIRYTGFEKPDLMVVLSEEGLEKVASYIGQLTEQDTLFINASLLPLEIPAKVIGLDFKGKVNKHKRSLLALEEVLLHLKIFPLEAWKEAISMREELAGENFA